MSIFSKIKDKILPPINKEKVADATLTEVTNEKILKEMVDCLENSIKKESVGKSLSFNAHYLIILHPDTYHSRQSTFPIVVEEVVEAFYEKIEEFKNKYPKLRPIANNWVFQFAPGIEFNSESIEWYEVKVIGSITGLNDSPILQNNSVKVTMKPRKSTNFYEKMDVNLSAFSHIDFRNEGKFAIKIRFGSEEPNGLSNSIMSFDTNKVYAEIKYHISKNDYEGVFQMKEKEIVIARKEPENATFKNYFLIESVYVSNPHARIRYNEAERVFQLANFSKYDTRLNEKLIPQSEPNSPVWVNLSALKNQILLNGDVTLQFFAKI